MMAVWFAQISIIVLLCLVAPTAGLLSYDFLFLATTCVALPLLFALPHRKIRKVRQQGREALYRRMIDPQR
ncbi:hypothetical protein M3P36_04280 [Altererythrobacter sp. KTW20L]|uniref:hypothetical protein n=1 Tax=Altererythrobacter sp. KTW20L TaxID=2942210 RepID=UPI0020BD74A8|nr:hypothetical protein [Altererythrobacter sp. KTW20L]MCL6250267.1 hypothetical protein [Altererythrobacter sp. KTW20L]